MTTRAVRLTNCERIADARKTAGELFETLNRTIKSEKGAALVKKVMDIRVLYVRATEAYMELIKAGQVEQAKKMLLTEVRETQRNYLTGT